MKKALLISSIVLLSGCSTVMQSYDDILQSVAEAECKYLKNGCVVEERKEEIEKDMK